MNNLSCFHSDLTGILNSRTGWTFNPQLGGVTIDDVCPSPTVPPPSFNPFYSGVINGPDFCMNLSLGGLRTHPHDSDGDDVADTCLLPYTRREAIAHHMAADALAKAYPHYYSNILATACYLLRDTDYGDHPEDLAENFCATGTAREFTPQEPQDTALFFSGVITGPRHCTNLSLGGVRTYAHDGDGDGIAETCSLPSTRRDAVAHYMTTDTLIANNRYQYHRRLNEACAALSDTDYGHHPDFVDHPDELAEDVCAPEEDAL